jgi:hypothetical protein
MVLHGPAPHRLESVQAYYGERTSIGRNTCEGETENSPNFVHPYFEVR